MKLYLVRHGESKGNVDRGYIAGRSDPNGLTTKGKSQIIRTSWELRHTHFKGIYSSPVARAKETAGILGTLMNHPVHHVDFLAEMSYGDFEGTYFWDDMEKKREAFTRWNTDITYAFPNGESLEMVSERVWNGYQTWSATIDAAAAGNILFVSHDAVLSVLLFSLLYGHPHAKDATASYRKAFMDFVHGIEVANGSVFIVDLHANPIKFHRMQWHKPHVPVTEESMRFYLRGLHSGNDISLEEKITASDNKVYHVRNETDQIVKFMQEKEIVSSERIISIYDYLKKNTDIPAPSIELYDKSQAFFEDTVLLQDYLPGKDQNEYLPAEECGEWLLEATFKMLGKIHAIPTTQVEKFWYPEDAWHKVHVAWHIYLSDEIDLTLKQLSRVLPDESCRTHVRASLHMLRDYVIGQTAPLKPLHGDFSPQNIIVTPNGELRILDFERARIGDALWDYAYFYGWLQRKFPNSTEYWWGLVTKKFTPTEQEMIQLYTILFHAWTVRDILQYKTNELRARRAEQSRMLLEKWARHKA